MWFSKSICRERGGSRAVGKLYARRFGRCRRTGSEGVRGLTGFPDHRCCGSRLSCQTSRWAWSEVECDVHHNVRSFRHAWPYTAAARHATARGGAVRQAHTLRARALVLLPQRSPVLALLRAPPARCEACAPAKAHSLRCASLASHPHRSCTCVATRSAAWPPQKPAPAPAPLPQPSPRQPAQRRRRQRRQWQRQRRRWARQVAQSRPPPRPRLLARRMGRVERRRRRPWPRSSRTSR
jgi:hypothetical protein